MASGRRVASAQAVFASAADANAAFKKLPCFKRAGKDNRGRPQKSVVLHEPSPPPTAAAAAADTTATPAATPTASRAATTAAASASPAEAPEAAEVDTTGMKASEARKARRAAKLAASPLASLSPAAAASRGDDPCATPAPSANGDASASLKASEARKLKRQGTQAQHAPKDRVTIMVRKNACHGGVMFAAMEDKGSQADGGREGHAARGTKRKSDDSSSSPFSRPSKRK